jgi:hypothetical protein
MYHVTRNRAHAALIYGSCYMLQVLFIVCRKMENEDRSEQVAGLTTSSSNLTSDHQELSGRVERSDSQTWFKWESYQMCEIRQTIE